MFKLTNRYIPALIVIAMFIILSNYLSQKNIASNKQYATLVNISGKQRMLSQRIVVLAYDYVEHRATKEQLKATMLHMQKSHKLLLQYKTVSKLHKIYFDLGLNKLLAQYIKLCNKIIQTQDKKYLLELKSKSNQILKLFDFATKEFEHYTQQQLDKLLGYETYLVIFALIILFLEAILIFYPASKQIEQVTNELKKEKEYEAMIIESNNDAIIAIDWTAKITTYNKKAQEIFGWNKEEMIGKRNLIKIIPPKYRQKHKIASEKYLQTGVSCGILGTTLELEALRKDGTIFPIIISFGSKYKPKGAIVVASIIDISAQKEQENALIQQSKMASMGEMISNIAHQWRQPLSLISTIATGTLAKKEMDILQDDDLIKSLDKINDSVQFLSKTIEDFRNFYKVTNKKQEFLVYNSISTIKTIISGSYNDHNITLIEDIEQKDKIICCGIQSQLSQVILNILNNAKDVLVEQKIKNPIVLIKLFTQNDNIHIEIYDNAKGIPDDIIHKIFEPYFTTKFNSDGTGIGLYMSYEIIQKHFKGTLSASNRNFTIDEQEYFGACFCITIPSNLQDCHKDDAKIIYE